MRQLLILYASSTGNTEEIAHILEQQIDRDAFAVTLWNLELDEIHAQELTKYDGVLFGTYTYDDGELPFETSVFCDSLTNVDLSGKVIGVFGSGDSAYYQFCEAVEVMKEEFNRSGAVVLEYAVKVDLYPDEVEELSSIKKLAGLIQQRLIIADEDRTAG